MKIVGRTFSPPMVLSILDDLKTQTRRLQSWHVFPGDLVYVREHWRTLQKHDKLKPKELVELYAKSASPNYAVRFEADGTTAHWHATEQEMVEVEAWRPGKHRQAMHMPRSASRAYLEVVSVRIEPLREITREDAIAEGIVKLEVEGTTAWRAHRRASVAYEDPRMAYRDLWNSINDEDGKRWEDNPLIHVITFTRHLGNVDQRDG